MHRRGYAFEIRIQIQTIIMWGQLQETPTYPTISPLEVLCLDGWAFRAGGTFEE